MQERVWILGGSESSTLLNTTSFLFLNGSTAVGPLLPKSLEKHCVTWASSKSSKVVLLGGQDYTNQYLAHTYIYDFEAENLGWTRGPEMLQKRSRFGCASFYDTSRQTEVLVSVGGYDLSGLGYHSSIEWVETNSLEKGIWSYGTNSTLKFQAGL